jgi:hypothetical protein
MPAQTGALKDQKQIVPKDAQHVFIVALPDLDVLQEPQRHVCRQVVHILHSIKVVLLVDLESVLQTPWFHKDFSVMVARVFS